MQRPVLLLSLDYPPNDGGISRLAAGIVRGWPEADQALSVVTLRAGGRQGIVRPDVLTSEVTSRKVVRDWQILRAIRSYLRAHGRDAPIIASVWNPEATLAILAGAKRVSILAHGNEVMPYGGLKGRLRRFVLRHAHRVICNSRFTETLVRDLVPEARTAVLNPAVDAEHFRPQVTQREARNRLGLPPDAPVLLTVARLDPIKGHETVLEAISSLPPDGRRDLVYAVIGKGEMMEPLQQKARTLGIAGHVRFCGFVSDNDLSLWYTAADVFLLCSVLDRTRRGMEGFGMALTEAQAAGLAVIGTRSGGIPDAIREGEGGWLIEERDCAALGQHLVRLATDRREFVQQGQLGAGRVRREMSWESYTRALAGLI